MHIISANNFECNATSNLYGKTVMCNHNEDCYISCTIKNCCKLATIYAPNNANLTLDVGSSTAEGITVYGAANGSLNIECRMWYGCRHAAIYAPTNGNLFLHCNGRTACLHANISCPNNGECDIRCDDGCGYTIIDATNMISGSLSISSITGSSTFTAFALLNSRIYCPHNNNNCNISCAYRGCKNATIYANNDASNLYIDAKDSEALKSSKILCPTGSGACSIKVNATETAIGIVSNAKIYAVNGVDFYFICYHLLDVNQCYDNSSKPILFYGDAFTESCVIELESGYNKWLCAHQSIANPTSTIIDTSVIEFTQSTSSQTELAPKTRISTTKSTTAFIIDELATIVIVICASLCALILFVFLIFALFKRRENKRNLKQENKILEVRKINIRRLNEKISIATMKTNAGNIVEENLDKVADKSVTVDVMLQKEVEQETEESEDSDSDDLYQNKESQGNVTVGAMIEDIVSTKGNKVSMVVVQEGEKDEIFDEDIEELYDNEGAQQRDEAIDRESMQNEYDLELEQEPRNTNFFIG